MNEIILTGNLVKNSEFTTGETEKGKWTREKFTVAEGGGNNTNYFNCEWWNGSSTAPHSKGTRVELAGHIKTESWIKDGKTFYSQTVVVDRCNFISKNTNVTTENEE